MKKYIKQIINRFLIIGCASILIASCQKDYWNDHYKQEDVRLDKNLLTIIKEDNELSKFAELLHKTGYDTLLTINQQYTVWAPVNSALANVSADTLNNPALLKLFIGNFISRVGVVTSDLTPLSRYKMLNGKYNYFVRESNNISFGGVNLISSNLLANNGILHKVSGVVHVRRNIWEFLSQSQGFDSVMNYLDKFGISMFDVAHSTRKGINSLGQNIYDSVFIQSSTYFNVAGSLNSEDSVYTYIGLKNNALIKSYNSFKEYYKYPVADTTKKYVYNAILKDITFRGAFSPSRLNDSIYSINSTKVKINPDYISEVIPLSNGNIYVVDSLSEKASDLFYKPLLSEAENFQSILKGSDALFSRTPDLNVSGGVYELITSTKVPSVNNYVEWKMFNVLSAKYDMYVKFVGNGSAKPGKVKYELVYKGTGSEIKKAYTGGLISNTTDTLMKIGTSDLLPLYINTNPANSYYVKLRIYLDVADAEKVLYDRRVGVDYVLFVPVP